MNNIKNIPLKYFIPLLLVIITLVVFYRVSGHEFVFCDDDVHVYKNPHMDPVTSSSFRHFWKKPHDFALTYTVWAIQAAFARTKALDSAGPKLNPHIFHITNLIFHILSVLMVFLILRILVRHDWAAFGGALLFAIHPVQVEPVAWVTGLKDLFSGFFSLAAVWQYLLFAKFRSAFGSVPEKNEEGYPDKKDNVNNGRSLKFRRKWLHYITAVIFFILALTAKPTAIVVPIIILILDVWILKRPVKKSIILLLGWIIIFLPLIILLKSLQPETRMEFITPLWARPFILGDALAFYIYKLFFPFSFGIDHGRSPVFVIREGLIYWTWLIPFILVLLFWLRRKRKPWLIASAGIFIAGILPVSGLISFRFQEISTVASRYLYISMLGPALAFAGFLMSSFKKPIIIICGLILSLLGVRSALQTKHWKNTFALFEHSLKVNPGSWNVHKYLGIALYEQQKFEEASIHFSKSLELKPNDAVLQNKFGMVLFKQEKFEQAVVHFTRAIKLQPNFEKPYSNLGDILLLQGQTEKAVACYTRAFRINPGYRIAEDKLIIALKKQGKSDKYILDYFKKIRIDQDSAEAYNQKGILFERQGKMEKAVASYSMALKKNPNYTKVYFNLGNAYYKQGKINKAVACYGQALKLKPDFIQVHNNLGFVLERQGKIDEAIAHYSEAVRINPGYTDARNNLLRAQKKQ